MQRAMHQMGEFQIRLDHISLISPLLGSRGGYGFSVVILGNLTHAFFYSSHDEAQAAYSGLLLAIGQATQGSQGSP
jgi:hypothetical protein